MEWLEDLSHAQDPAVVIVGEMQDGRFHLNYCRYPQASVRVALAYRKELLTKPRMGATTIGLGEAIGYYANFWTIGRGAEASAWLRRNLPSERWENFADDLPEINQRLKRLSQLIWRNDRRDYTVKSHDQPWWPDR